MLGLWISPVMGFMDFRYVLFCGLWVVVIGCGKVMQCRNTTFLWIFFSHDRLKSMLFARTEKSNSLFKHILDICKRVS